MATSHIHTMWGPNPYAPIDQLENETTVAGLTHRYAHGEIQDARQYQDLLGVVVQKVVKDETARYNKNTVRIKRACILEINKRLYGKTPLEMLISFESFIRLAEEETPEAAYRLSLKRTFEGIFALYQAAGRYIDVDYTNSALGERYGTPDLEINITGLCAFFPLDMYDSTKAADGSLKFSIHPRGTFVQRDPTTPLISSIVFDFIKFLWPNVPTHPEMDPPSFTRFLEVLQRRQDLSIDKVMEMFHVSTNEDGLTHMSLNPLVFVNSEGGVEEHDLDVQECVTRMMALRKYDVPLTDKDIAAIAAADAVAIPIVTEWMNRARLTGGML